MAFAPDGRVFDLTNAKFTPFLQNNDVVLVCFYQDGLETYERLLPEYEEAARKSHQLGIKFAKVDCAKVDGIPDATAPTRYPTVHLFRKAKPARKYVGTWKAAEIVAFLTRESLPTISKVKADYLDGFRAASSVVVVGYHESESTVAQETFRSAAEAIGNDILFGISNDGELAKSEGIKCPGIALYKAFDEGKNILEGTHDVATVTAFIKCHSKPLIAEFYPETHATYLSAGIPLGYVFIESKDTREYLVKEVEPIAKTFKGEIQFGIVDIEVAGSIVKDIHLDESKPPRIALQDSRRERVVAIDPQADISRPGLDIFVRGFLEGDDHQGDKA